jgi:hypothetical protein
MTQHWEKINGNINKENWIIQEAQWLCFYHFIQDHTKKSTKKVISWRIGFDRNSNNMKSFQFKNNNSTEIFQLLDNITVDRWEGLCNELRWEKQAIILY